MYPRGRYNEYFRLHLQFEMGRRWREADRRASLCAVRKLDRRTRYPPMLPAADLQNEDIVRVIMRREAGCISRRQIGVGVNRVA